MKHYDAEVDVFEFSCRHINDGSEQRSSQHTGDATDISRVRELSEVLLGLLQGGGK